MKLKEWLAGLADAGPPGNESDVAAKLWWPIASDLLTDDEYARLCDADGFVRVGLAHAALRLAAGRLVVMARKAFAAAGRDEQYLTILVYGTRPRAPTYAISFCVDSVRPDEAFVLEKLVPVGARAAPPRPPPDFAGMPDWKKQYLSGYYAPEKTDPPAP